MTKKEIVQGISRGRTDLIMELLKLEDWKSICNEGPVKLIQWLVYYNDLTAIKLILENGGDLNSISINEELGNAAFFGHWKICDFLINKGADVNFRIKETGETPLHNTLSKAGRPYYIFTLRLLLEKGAEVNVRTIPGKETGAFMRDVRTKGETPLHRAAAYADENMIRLLLEYGADKTLVDAHGDSPISWASIHLRPGNILKLLEYGNHRISDGHVTLNKSDHGAGWGNSMDWNLFGDYLPDKDFEKG